MSLTSEVRELLAQELRSQNPNVRRVQAYSAALKALRGGSPILKTVGTAAAIGGGLALGAHGIGSAYEALHRVATRKRNLNRMYDEFPELKKKPVQSEKAFSVLQQYAPELAKSPQVAGSWVKKVVEYPEAGVSPTSIRDLIEAQRALAEARTTAGTIGGLLRGIAEPGTRAAIKDLSG